MGLETGTTIASLNALWPLGSDPKSQGDDHLRLIKGVLQGDVVSKSGDTMTGQLFVTPTMSAVAPTGGNSNIQLRDDALNPRGAITYNSADGNLYMRSLAAGGAVRSGFVFSDGVILTEGTTVRVSVLEGTFGANGARLASYIGNNRLAFGFNSPNVVCNIDGATTVTIGSVSDYRLKDVTGPIDDALNIVAQLNPVEYMTKGCEQFPDLAPPTPERRMGLIAHEVQALLPHLVTGERDSPDTLQSLDYAGLTPVLVAAVQELTAEVARLRAQVDALSA